MTEKTLRSMRWGVVGLLLLMIWPVYRGMILYTMVMFKEPLEDMSHGWVVPFVSLFVLWRQRNAFRKAAGAPSVGGFLWVCLFMAIAWFGGRGMQSRMEQISLIGLIWAVPYAFWGKRVARLMLFPAAFLIFTIPVSSFVDFFTIHLRVISSSLATFLLNGLGVAVEQAGTALFSRVPGAEFNVDVADGCSGIRSLFAMMALTAAYAYFSPGTFFQKWILFFCSVPLAVFGNICRIFSICLVATWFGQKAALGFYHDFSGYVIFLAGVLLMIQTQRLLEKGHPLLQRAEARLWAVVGGGSPSADVAQQTGRRARPLLVVLGTLALALGIFLSHALLPPPASEAADFIATSLPQDIGGYVSGTPLFCHNERCLKTIEKEQLKSAPDANGSYRCPDCGEILHTSSLAEVSKLPRDTVILKRNYRSPDGVVYGVSVVIGGLTRGGIHRPELCLPAQGFTMSKAVRYPLRITPGKPTVARMISTRRQQEPPVSLVYWFVSRERESSSHTMRIWADIWDRSIHNRINRWAMIDIHVSPALGTADDIARLETFLRQMYPCVVLKRGRE
jgi:EpsI family protein